MRKKIKEEDHIEFTKYEQLTYLDEGEPEVTLYVDDRAVGNIKVWRDSEMDNREYICINYEIVYLDELTETKIK
jgi:hypothetical protein